MNCARCDYTAADLTEHAFTSGHLLCVVCRRRSLTAFEAQTCPACVGAVRADLADIVAAYTLLRPDGLVGLTLTGDGTMQRRAHGYELASLHPSPHPLATDGESVPKPIRDEWASDPLPVLPALVSWEDWLRQEYRDGRGAVPATLTATVDYLTRNLDAGHVFAQTFAGFDEFAGEVARHRSSARFAAGLADDPVSADARCFDCGGPLLRTYRPADADVLVARRQHARRAVNALLDPVRRQRAAERSYGIRDVTPLPATKALEVARLALVGTDAEGLVDDWTCGHCRRVYDQPSYFLALRAAASMWVRVPVAAETAQRSVWTLRSWVRRGLVTAACRVLDRAVVVWWPDVSDRAFRHADDAASQQSA